MITVAVTLGLLAVPALATPLSTSTEPLIRGNVGLNLAPVVSHPSAEQAIIPNQYIVVLKPEATLDDLNAHAMAVQSHDETSPLTDGPGLTHIFDGVLKGVAGKFSDATLDKIRAMPEVDYIERDQVVYAIREPVEKYDTQKASPWGLARISHREKLSLSTFSTYVYDSTGGEGVDVYVIDTGINIDHVEFEGRAHWGHTAIEDGVDDDDNGHGTHCAGTIASAKYGVAKKAQVHAVKVLGSNGSGSMSDVVAGVTWASKQAQAKAIEAIKEFRATGKTSHKGSVANMSLGGSKSPALDTAIDTAVRNGMHFAVAAGNDNRDACSYSPAGAELAVTVGASTIGDERAYFSNYGKCVDIFAPGLNIKSTWIGDNTAQSILSGTSMASPHVAGLLAYYLSIRGTATFNPVLSDASKALVSNWNPTAAVMAILPNWMSAFIPASFIEKNMPASVSVESFYNEDGTLDVTQFGGITPAQLKKALIELGERDKLNDLPPETVNILAFNNATNAAGYPWY
ncbi:Peptidase inhibitor I9, partial [Rhizoctonia solani]